MEYSISIATFDQRFELFSSVIEEIKRQRPSIEISVQVNGNYKEKNNEGYRKKILKFLSEYENINPQFYSYFASNSKMWNRGIQNTTNNMVCVLSDDIEISEGFFDFIEERINFATNSYFIFNNVFCYFLIDKSYLAKMNWFDERYLGIGWEDLEFVSRTGHRTSMDTDKIKIVIPEGEPLEKPAQSKISGWDSSKYSYFNRLFWISESEQLTTQYPYYEFEQENYDKLGEPNT